MNTNQKIAKVHLTTRFKQLMVAVLSVTFGISMYVFMNSFMAGVNNAQTQITFTSMPHIKIYNDLPSHVEPIIQTDDPNTLIMVNNARNIQYSEGIKNADALKINLVISRKLQASPNNSTKMCLCAMASQKPVPPYQALKPKAKTNYLKRQSILLRVI